MKCYFPSITPVLETANLTFAVEYFNQKTPNSTLVKHFLPRNTQDKMNAFGRNLIYFSVKIYTH